jgi:Ca2+-binding EF-hand superfamily protein
MLAALALALPACVADTGPEGSDPESAAQSSAELEQQANDGPAAKNRGRGMRDGMKRHFADADADNDGQITRQEIEKSVAARFAKVDSDGDGALSTDELTAMKKAHRSKLAGKRGRSGKGMGADKRPGKMLKRIDTNDDGTVSLDEFSSHALQRFEKADADGNDVVTMKEMESSAKAFKGHRGGKKGKRGHKGGGMARLLEADSNDDGQITKAEAEAHRGAKFDELDQNNDGVLGPDERPAKKGRRGSPRDGEGRGKGMSRMDQNQDGQVSRDEFLAGTARMFERHDKNKDDVISADELKAKPMNHRKGRRGSARVGR